MTGDQRNGPASAAGHPMLYLRPLYLARSEAAAYVSLAESTIEKLVAANEFPPPRKLTKGRTGWLVDELDAWGRARPVSDLAPARNSGYGRAGKPTAAGTDAAATSSK